MRSKFTYIGFFITVLFLIKIQIVNGQGCVAIRGFSSCSPNLSNGVSLYKGEISVGTNFRYFKSFRHFRGSEEETNRVADGTQVINNSYFLDIAVDYGITDRLYSSFLLPIVYHDRSSMYEHGGNPPNGLGDRHSTQAYGISDMRLGVGYWLIDPLKSSKFNLALGTGLKLPTGKYDYTDIFYNQGSDRNINEEKVVDQSIQPGDGGLGWTVDLQGYQFISHGFFLTTNLYYLFNPKATNGVLTRGGNSEFSCPDQFAARLGMNYVPGIKSLSVYLGARAEGVPSEDLIGSSEGYRRPGYVISVEPGVSFMLGKVATTIDVPVAIVRNRTQSYQDKARTKETGTYRHGDAAFADYLISVSFAYQFGGKKRTDEMQHVPLWQEITTEGQH